MDATLEGAGPFHEGELALQEATGEREVGAGNGRIIVDRMIPNAVPFIARQELAVVASVDGDGQPWCSALLGPPGSFAAPGLDRVELARGAGRGDDPLWDNVRGDPRVGVLFIEVGSRRRYRVNGQVPDPDADPLLVEVREAFPNCPKYIARRYLMVGRPDTGDAPVALGEQLGGHERRIIAAAETCLVASANPAGQLDASHRGGRPGFVQYRDGQLWVPDYRGNSMFNTLGNLAINPAAGLLFVDFEGHETLQLTGTTAIDLKAGHPDDRTGGTGRGWTFTPLRWRRAPLAARVRAELLEPSPFNP
ncbi:MAG: pyridoxamine 5'-phosphate oxidase family protein [Actinobacteria bacterium]|nr:pyridoxamine 5'-phosphate oxidase family protein [Actinomycetota bacterium]